MGLLTESRKVSFPTSETYGPGDNSCQLFDKAAYTLGGFPRGPYEDQVERRLSARSRRERRSLRASVVGVNAPPVKVYPHFRHRHIPVDKRRTALVWQLGHLWIAFSTASILATLALIVAP